MNRIPLLEMSVDDCERELYVYRDKRVIHKWVFDAGDRWEPPGYAIHFVKVDSVLLFQAPRRITAAREAINRLRLMADERSIACTPID